MRKLQSIAYVARDDIRRVQKQLGGIRFRYDQRCMVVVVMRSILDKPSLYIDQLYVWCSVYQDVYYLSRQQRQCQAFVAPIVTSPLRLSRSLACTRDPIL